MKKNITIIALIASLIANAGLVYFFMFKGDVVEVKNQRQAIMMTEENREIVLKEMRDFLESVKVINEGILENNPAKIIESARSSGNCVKDEVPKGLIKSLPIAFKKMGFGTHDLFDELADSVRINFNPKQTQRQLNRILNNCVACHQIYQIKTTSKDR